MRKLLVVLGLCLTGVAAAQDGWQHELRSVFPEPLEHLMLPWVDPVELRDVSVCWPDQAEIPFLGAEHEFWCYFVPGKSMRTAFRDFRTALQDLRMTVRLNISDDVSAELNAVSPRTGERIDAWHQGEADGGVLVGVAWRAGSEPEPLFPAGPAAAPSERLP